MSLNLQLSFQSGLRARAGTVPELVEGERGRVPGRDTLGCARKARKDSWRLRASEIIVDSLFCDFVIILPYGR